MVLAYLTIVEFGKRRFFERVPPPILPPRTHALHRQRVLRGRVERWTRHEPPQIWPKRRR